MELHSYDCTAMSNKNAPQLTHWHKTEVSSKNRLLPEHHVWFHLVLVIKTKTALLVLIPVILNELIYILDERQMQLPNTIETSSNLGPKPLVYGTVWPPSTKSTLVPNNISLRAERGKTLYPHISLTSPVIIWVGGGREQGEQMRVTHLIWFYPLWEILC